LPSYRERWVVVMGRVTVATQWIDFNEPAFRLREMNLQAPNGTGWHRYQIISVVRDDRLAEYQEDLGPREDFSADEFEIPGGVWDSLTGKGEILHTVAELRAYAAAHRQEGSFPSGTSITVVRLCLRPTLPRACMTTGRRSER